MFNSSVSFLSMKLQGKFHGFETIFYQIGKFVKEGILE